MRLGIELELSDNKIPKDYRRGFASLIKGAMSKEAEAYLNRLYSDRIDKPFTFSIYFPELKGHSNGVLNVGKNAILNFSTNDHELLIYLYNGFRKLKAYKWQDYKFTLKKTKALFKPKILSDKCVFKTISPYLVNNRESNLTYFSVNNPAFDEAFRHSISGICNNFLDLEDPIFDYQIIKHKKMVVSHYNQYMTCNKGIIEIKADPKILNLIYDVGIGVRRSQGFGMLDTV